MWQSYCAIWLHFIWTTKDRELLIPENKKIVVYKFIREAAEEDEITLDFIGGMSDHIQRRLQKS